MEVYIIYTTTYVCKQRVVALLLMELLSKMRKMRTLPHPTLSRLHPKTHRKKYPFFLMQFCLSITTIEFTCLIASLQSVKIITCRIKPLSTEVFRKGARVFISFHITQGNTLWFDLKPDNFGILPIFRVV